MFICFLKKLCTMFEYKILLVWSYIAIKALLFIVLLILKYHKKSNVAQKPTFGTFLPAKILFPILFPWVGSNDARSEIKYDPKSPEATSILCNTLKETLSSKTSYWLELRHSQVSYSGRNNYVAPTQVSYNLFQNFANIVDIFCEGFFLTAKYRRAFKDDALYFL